MTRPRVLVTNWVHEPVLARLSEQCEVEANPHRTPWTVDEVRQRAAGCDAMLAFMPDRVDRAFLAACPSLKMIACALKGFDNFDLEACAEAGVHLSIVPDLLTEPTAELAVGLAIGLARKIRHGDALVRAGQFDGWRPVLYGAGLDGATVGIVGMGAVGQAIARRLAGFGCRLLGVDPFAAMPDGVTAATLDDALAAARYVIVAAPLTATSRGMIGQAALARMRPDALLVNIGRGSVVDEAAVAEALIAGRLAGYAADVFGFEDWALADRPGTIPAALLAHPDTLFTPHLGSAVEEVRLAIAMQASENILAWVNGRSPPDEIRPQGHPEGGVARSSAN
jgi:phosphonate dehydrogenase